MSNVTKSKTMPRQSGAIHTLMLEKDFSQRGKGEGGTYRENLQQIILCSDCGVELIDGCRMDHIRNFHGTEPAIDWYQLIVRQTEHIPLVYELRFPTNMHSCQC